MAKVYSIFITIVITIILSGCFWYDSYDTENIIGNYYVVRITGNNEHVGYCINKDNNDYLPLVGPSVYEVQWNSNFILVKQHPDDSVKTLAYGLIHRKAWMDLAPNNLSDYTKLYSDTIFNKKVDDFAKEEYQRRMENGELTFLTNAKQSDITFYYLIDIKNNPKQPKVYFNMDSLNVELNNLKVGHLENRRVY